MPLAVDGPFQRKHLGQLEQLVPVFWPQCSGLIQAPEFLNGGCIRPGRSHRPITEQNPCCPNAEAALKSFRAFAGYAATDPLHDGDVREFKGFRQLVLPDIAALPCGEKQPLDARVTTLARYKAPRHGCPSAAAVGIRYQPTGARRAA